MGGTEAVKSRPRELVGRLADTAYRPSLAGLI